MARADLDLAKKAADVVNPLVGQDKRTQQAFRTRARQLPAMIATLGLAQTVVFLEAKARGNDREAQAYKTTLRALGTHLEEVLEVDGEWKLSSWIVSGRVPPHEYRLATREALEVAGWIKRLAEAKLEGA